MANPKRFHPEKMLIRYRTEDAGPVHRVVAASHSEALVAMGDLEKQHPGCLSFRIPNLRGQDAGMYGGKQYYSYGPLPLEATPE